MDQKYLAEIKAREQAATRGPWEVKTNRHPETTGEAWGWIKGPCENWCWTDMRSSSRHDAEFIAHARTDIPALLAEVERLRDCKCVDKCKLVCMLDECDKIVEERNTLKKALELMVVSLRENNFNCPDADYFIQQAQEQEAKDEKA
jgi:hypothetical protein